MAKYINAETLIEELGAGCMPIYWRGISGIPGDEDCIMDYIESAPAADVRPERHGKWRGTFTRPYTVLTPSGNKVKGDIIGYICSECGGGCLNRSVFCPNCGAKMKGGKV